MTIFYREHFTQLWLTLSSNESLGILDSAYIEDYYGNDGQLTLYNTQSGVRYPMLMADISAQGPPHEIFRGYYDLSLIQDGLYQIQGRIRDIVGNYTILSDFYQPLGTETVEPMTFSITIGFSRSVAILVLDLLAGATMSLNFARKDSVPIMIPQSYGMILTPGQMTIGSMPLSQKVSMSSQQATISMGADPQSITLFFDNHPILSMRKEP